MSIINYTNKEVQFKIVLHGPPFAGKSTTMSYIHSQIDAAAVSDLTTLKSAADKTLFFDFVPRDATLLDGFNIRFELFTVSGNAVFNAPRNLVLRDADGILFVADSAWTQIEENVRSFKNLGENLEKLGGGPDDMPVVLQYNKRDLPDVAPVSYLDFVLNNRKQRMPAFGTSATTGKNVFASLQAISQILIHRFNENSPKHPAVAQPGIAAVA